MGRQFKASNQPLFTYLITVATHQPYTNTYAPEENVPGGGAGTNPEMHEFLRRLWLAKADYEWMKGELKRRFPNEKFLILQYGDHQPIATRAYFGNAQALPPRRASRQGSAAFITYYATEGINYDPPRCPMLMFSTFPTSPAWCWSRRAPAVRQLKERKHCAPCAGPLLRLQVARRDPELHRR